jgi:hypothetical protein
MYVLYIVLRQLLLSSMMTSLLWQTDFSFHQLMLSQSSTHLANKTDYLITRNIIHIHTDIEEDGALFEILTLMSLSLI